MSRVAVTLMHRAVVVAHTAEGGGATRYNTSCHFWTIWKDAVTPISVALLFHTTEP